MKVLVNAGRNNGQVGVVLSENGNDVYVDFGRNVLVNEGFGSIANYPDGYWIKKKYVEEV